MTTKLQSPADRLAYIDWMRGLACVLMIQDHCYDSWLTPEARLGLFYRGSQLVSTLAAPIFIFLSGVSFALVTERMLQKNVCRTDIFRAAVVRGLQILGLGFLLRVQEYVLGYPKSPWTDLLRVDVLNVLGISIILMALFWRVVVTSAPPRDRLGSTQAASLDEKWRTRAIGYLLLLSTVIALVTPPLWTTHRPRFLPWMLESYVNGVHIYEAPQPWIFCIFPWVAFAFVGLALGLFLVSDFAQARQARAISLIGAIGVVACASSFWWDYSRTRIYAVYDYWHSSPNFFLLRCGILLILVFGIYAWCRWGPATRGFSPFIQLGKTSLLVYWVHIEFVYGRLSILPKARTSIPLATIGMFLILAAMLGLSIWRTNRKSRAGLRVRTIAAQRLGQVM